MVVRTTTPSSLDTSGLEARLATFTTATPALLERCQLLTRVDSKFVVPADRVDDVLAALAEDYAVVRVEAGALATYQSLYFDSPSLQCFHDHRRGRLLRHKIRIRHYPDRALSYLEVKTKRSQHVTAKRRHPLAYGQRDLDADARGFLRAHVASLADELAPALWIGYSRISLVGRATLERVTLDLGLVVGEPARPLPGLDGIGVLEIKQARLDTRSPAMRTMAAARLRPRGMSKYVVGQALSNPELRRNRLRPALRALEALTR